MKIVAERLGKGGPILMSRGGKRCPDVFRLQNGDFLVIGEEVKDISAYSLPDDASCDLNEKAVIIPKAVMLSAIGDIVNDELNK